MHATWAGTSPSWLPMARHRPVASTAKPVAPATHVVRLSTTTVPGGPTYREAQLCMEMIADTGALASLDVMELNPACDVRNKTADLAVDLIESLFGKSTLMRDPGKNSRG